MDSKQKEGFYTAEGVDVESRIDKGLTKFFPSAKTAEEYAYSHNSYKYEVFSTPHSSSRKLIGYGVPK